MPSQYFAIHYFSLNIKLQPTIIYRAPNTDYSIQSTDCWVQGIQYWTLNTQYEILSIQYRVLSTIHSQYWILNNAQKFKAILLADLLHSKAATFISTFVMNSVSKLQKLNEII